MNGSIFASILLQGLALAAWLLGAHEKALESSQPLARGRVTSPAFWGGPTPLRVVRLQAASQTLFEPPIPDGPGLAEPGAPVPILQPGRPDPRAGASRSMLLPDLRTLPPSDLEIQVDRHGERELRLTNIIWNSGAGPLEVIGEFNRATRRTHVRQRVYDQRQDSQKTFQEIPVGEFVWHPTHDHWHMEGFVLYRLWSLTADGGLDRVVSSSDKLSYCLMDTDVIDRQNPGYLSRRRYYECDQTLQGLSAGWGDKYKSYLDGQSLDLSGVSDGFYVLESAANPDGVLLETNSGNNSATVTVEIRGRQVMVAPEEELSERRCDENGWC